MQAMSRVIRRLTQRTTRALVAIGPLSLLVLSLHLPVAQAQPYSSGTTGAASGMDILSPRQAAEPEAEGDYQVVRALVTASRSARISSQMQGRIIQLPLRMGDAFTAGDLLVEFDCDQQRAYLAAARAEVAKADADLQSKRSLLELEAVSPLEVILAESEKEHAEAGLARARADIKHCRIAAPFIGRMVHVEANQYEIVSPGEVLLEIVEAGELHVEALVPSRWLRWLEVGYDFSLQVDELGELVDAEVTALGARVDPVSQTVAIRARIKEARDSLRPGMSGDARFRVPD